MGKRSNDEYLCMYDNWCIIMIARISLITSVVIKHVITEKRSKRLNAVSRDQYQKIIYDLDLRRKTVVSVLQTIGS